MQVTVGISFFNDAKTIELAIRSVLAQSFQDWELILLDDGSTDNSFEIANSVRDARIRLVRDGENRGLGARLNQIAYMAQGTFIARMDADDVMHPDRLMLQMNLLNADTHLDVVGSAVYSIDADYRVTGVRQCNGVAGNVSAKRALRNSLFAHMSVMARRSWCRQFPYDESWRRLQDRDLWCRTAGKSRFGHLAQSLMFVFEPNDTKLCLKYLRSCQYERRLLLRHGPSLAGWPETSLLLAKSYLKSIAYGVGNRMGIQQFLIDRRNDRLSGEELLEAQRVLDEVCGLRQCGHHTPAVRRCA